MSLNFFKPSLPRPSSLSCPTFVLPPSFRSFQSHACGFFSAFARATCSLSVYSQYLGLGFNAPVFTPHTQADLLVCSKSIALRLRGCHSLWPRFPTRSTHVLDQHCATSPHLLQGGIQHALCGFRSHYLPHRIKLSFPAGTKIFQFPAYACLSARFGNPGFKA